MAISYQALIFLPPGTDATLEDAYNRLLEKYSQDIEAGKVKITLSDGELSFRRGKWSMEIYEDSGPHVIGEAKEIADSAGPLMTSSGMLALSRRRFDLSSDPDPEAKRTNDFLDVVIELSSFPGAVAFDPSMGIFI